MARFINLWIIGFLFCNFLFAQSTSEKKIQDLLKRWANVDMKGLRESPLFLSAGYMEIKEQPEGMKIWIATEGVRLWQGDVKSPILEMICDQAVVWFKPAPEEKEEKKSHKDIRSSARQKAEKAMFYAEGNVHFYWGDNYFRGSRIFFDLIQNRGIVLDSILRSSTKIEKKELPLYLRAHKLWIQSEKNFLAEDAAFSTCQFGIPHYHFEAKEIIVTELDRKVFVQARENTLWALGFPFFYIPYVAGENIEHWPLKKIHYGRSSRWGHHLLTTWGVNLYQEKVAPDSSGLEEAKWLLDIDAREKRGIAIGPHILYEGTAPNRSSFSGKIYGYYVHDQPMLDLGESMSQKPGKDDEASWDRRYRIYGVHRHRFPGEWTLDMELSRISDRKFLTDFFEEEARESKYPETYLYVRKLWHHHAFTFFSNGRLNDYQTQIEYLPQATYQVVYQPLFSDNISGLYWSSRFELSHVRRKDDKDSPTPFDGRHIVRSDWYNTISYGFSLGPLHFLPFLGGRISYFEEGADGDRNLFRRTGECGVASATNFYRFFEWKSSFFETDRVLHVFTPQFRYQWIYGSSHGPDDLIPYDSLENVDKMQLIQVIFTNRLRTMREGKISDFLFFEAIFSYFPERDLAKQGITTTDQGLKVSDRWEKFDNLRLDFWWSIRSNLWFRSRSEFNFQLREFEIFNTALGYSINKQVSVSLDNRYHRNNSNITTATVAYVHDEKWSFRLSTQFDSREGKMRECKFLIQRIFHRFALDIHFKYDPVDNDKGITASFYPIDVVSH